MSPDGHDAKDFGVTQTTAAGTYTFRKRITKTLYILAYVNQYSGVCTDKTSSAPGGCVDESMAPPRSAPALKVTPTKPKPPPKKKRQY